MKKSILNLVNLLKSKLMEFPALVNSLEKKEITLVDKFLDWIKSCEEIFTTYNISEVSELSGLRSKIIAPKFSENKNTGIRKAQLREISIVLYDVQNTVLNIIKPYEYKLEECRELVRQLLQIINQTQEVKYDQESDFSIFIDKIWQVILSNEQLKAGAIKLKANLPFTDILLLLSEEINLEDF